MNNWKDRAIRAKTSARTAFTLVELMAALLAGAVLLLALAGLIASGHRQWRGMYNRVYSDIVTDGYAAREAFDVVARKATFRKCVVGGHEDIESPTLTNVGQSLLLFYYSSEAAPQLDRYAWFYWSRAGRELKVQYGAKQSWYVDMSPADGSPDTDADGSVIFNPNQWKVPAPDATARTVTLARNVVYCHFWQGDNYVVRAPPEGRCVRMVLTLDDGEQSINVTCAAKRRNR
ncbi:MAG: hypothetical protein IH624_20445 [Phycisphaerae bacterium]|nr:hypothetical protein [Phycisphaerae bacterium]